MKWTPGYRSDDVEVRQGQSSPRGAMGSGLLGGILPLVMSRFGIGGVVVLVIGFFLFQHFAGGIGGGADSNVAAEEQSAAPATGADPKADPRVQFASFVLDDVQKTWAERFNDNVKYKKAKLVIFTNSTPTGCGYGESATGPFYCPRDNNVYLDLGFFQTLSQRLGANGDFAQAYVIAHEVGHHVQNQLGLTDAAHTGTSKQTGANGSSVRIELQADCFAGIWAHDTAKRDVLEGGDLEEALNAASSIGDDRLQKMGHGTVQPESWTHGSSAERVKAFKTGYQTGDFKACNGASLL